jgi:hypothetical protein
MITKTKTERLLTALNNGSEISTPQAISRFGFESPNAVTSAIRNLRENGHAVYTNKVNGVTKYRVGTPSRAVIAAGYRALGISAYVR